MNSGPQWTDIVIAVTAILATIAASAAAIFAFKQARSAEAQLSEGKRSREATLRPVLVATDVVRKDHRVELTVRNIGPGPAMGIRGRIWLTPLSAVPETIAEVESITTSAAQMVGSGAPQSIDILIGHIAAGANAMVPTDDIEFNSDAPCYIAVVDLRFDDVFGNHLPELGGYAGNTMLLREEHPLTLA